MTRPLTAVEVASRVQEALPDAVEEYRDASLWVRKEWLFAVCRWLKENPEYALDYLVAVTGVDHIEHFEMVYHLASIQRNHSLVLKTRVYGRESPSVPSLTPLWQGADLQEREVWDLMGIAFEGHPNQKRILTWEGFPGHPLRKDHLGG
ncbi:MAG: NADH-quinone oxidoreductase subunit C [Chloroflexi bacterium]|nr:NADH-quinone oxidoreductase subunit C [Chloroflexota bacterium]